MKRFLPVVPVIAFLFFLSFKAKAQNNQTVTNGDATSSINFTGTGCTYKWINNAPGIGLSGSGTGNIASFTAINNSTSPVIATIAATPVSTGYAYISNTATNTILVINIATNTVIDSIAVGSAPYSVAVSPDGSHIYVANSGDGTVSVIDAATNVLVATVLTGLSPSGIAVSPDGRLVYVTNTNGNTVTVIRAASNALVATIPVGLNPYGVSVSPDGSKVYITNRLSNNVSVITTSTNVVTATISVGAEPQAICISPDGTKVYVANTASASISVISTLTNTLAATCQVSGISPVGMCLNPNASLMYVANFSSNNISVINTATNTEIATFPEGPGPVSVSLSPDGINLYVVNNVAGTFSLINTSTKTTISFVSVGEGAAGSLGNNFISYGPGCNGSPVTFTITVNPSVPSSVAIVASANNICAGGSVTFTAEPMNGGNAPSYQWVVNGNHLGSNSLTFTSNALNDGDSIYCIMTSSVASTIPVYSAVFYMKVNPLPTIAFVPDTVFITDNNGAQLTPSITGTIAQYQWSPTDGLNKTDIAGPLANPVHNTIYQLTVLTDKGCKASGKVAVIFAQALKMPGAFTPNGDGHNDVFRIPPGVQISLQKFEIFDRWGSTVFITQNLAQGWDGTHNGKPAVSGAYVYIIKGTTLAGKPVMIKGTVVLIR
ncbi:MAG TPA: beta-propeller fold lactonase family protein [Puia sp.]|nr:beta-propeller fold lactonase family protein [Puia sp.]